MGGVFFGRNAIDVICPFRDYIRSGNSFRCIVDATSANQVRDEAQGAQIDDAPGVFLWISIFRIHNNCDEVIVVGNILDL